jgi:hypothetical protein
MFTLIFGFLVYHDKIDSEMLFGSLLFDIILIPFGLMLLGDGLCSQ